MPSEVTHEELEAVFPWVCYLPPEAAKQFLVIVESYREAEALNAKEGEQ